MTSILAILAAPACGATVLSWIPDAALQPAATLLAPAVALIGALAAARLLYRSTVGVARRNLLVGTVTSERAEWRKDMRRRVSRLVALAYAMPSAPSRKDMAAFDRIRVEVRLRLNPSLKPAHLLDQRILAALKALRTALIRGEQVQIADQIEIVECNVQALLKQEWEKSKTEADTGKLVDIQSTS